MSPPVTLDFARPPRSAKRTNVGHMPVCEAAVRIGTVLVGDVARKYVAYGRPGIDAESSQSTVQSILNPSFHSRHALGLKSQSLSTDPSIESMIRNIGLGHVVDDSGQDGDDSCDDSFDQTTMPGPLFTY